MLALDVSELSMLAQPTKVGYGDEQPAAFRRRIVQ